MLTVVALDPGVTTGIARGIINDHDNSVIIKYFQEAYNELELYHYLEAERSDFLVYESFQYRPGKAKPSVNLRPVELIGVIKLYGQLRLHYNSLYAQSAATGKAFWTDDKLKAENLYDKRYRHGRDACRHLLQWIRFGAGYNLVKNPVFQLDN